MESFIYLGLTIDQHMTFNPAIELMHRKAAHKLKTLYSIRIDYGIVFMSSCHNRKIQRLQILQNRILKCALGLHRLFSTLELHKLAQVLTIKDRIKYKQLVLIHHDILTQTNLFPLRHNTASGTRSTDTIQVLIPKPNTEHFRKSLFYNGPSEWNTLPEDLKTCQSLPAFKIRLKRRLLGSYDNP